MQIILKQEMYQIKNGFAARSPQLKITAHGFSTDVARQNLERTALLFLKPFERQGNLKEVIERLGIMTEDNGVELAVCVVE